jgi:K+-transporting ATPase ATPase A chain
MPVLCIACGLAAKQIVPTSAGTLPTSGTQFVGVLIGTVVIVGGLTFLPALALGPVAEHFAMQAGVTY